MQQKVLLQNMHNTPLDKYIKKLEDSILNFCLSDEKDYFDIRDIKIFKNKNILDTVKLYYRLNSIIKIVIKNIDKIKPNKDFFSRNKIMFIKRKTIQNNLHKIFDFKLRYKYIYLIYTDFYTLVEEVNDHYRVKIFVGSKIQIKFYFNENGLYIICPNLKKCKHCKTKILNQTKTCYKKSRSSLGKCYDVQFEGIEEPVFPSKLCISELYTLYNLNILFTPIIKTKDTTDRLNDYSRNHKITDGIYISKTRIKYLTSIKRENKEKKTIRPHTRIGHWRTYKKTNTRIWIQQTEVNQKRDIKKINKTPYII